MRSLLPVTDLLLSACKSTPEAMTDKRVAYACDRAPGIIVIYAGDTARIVGPGSNEEILLQRRPSGSGFWFESPTHSVRGKGKQITYTVGRMVPMTCTAL